VCEGNHVLDRVRQNLKAGGLTLKGEDGGPVDLREGQVQLPGFTLSREEDRVVFSPGKHAHNGLRKDLAMAHEGPNPPLTARQAVTGWLTSPGPASESCAESHLLHDVLRIAADYGFLEIGTVRSLRATWRNSWEQWSATAKGAGLLSREQGIPTEGRPTPTQGEQAAVDDGDSAGRQIGEFNLCGPATPALAGRPGQRQDRHLRGCRRRVPAGAGERPGAAGTASQPSPADKTATIQSRAPPPSRRLSVSRRWSTDSPGWE
jgi:hypothetical protein